MAGAIDGIRVIDFGQYVAGPLAAMLPDDPRADVAAWEGVVGAATATYGLNRDTGRPVYTAIPISSCYAAFQATGAIAIVLHYRERTGLGQRIEVPLFDATFGAIGSRG